MNVNKSVNWESTPGALNVWLDSPNRRVNVLDLELITGLEAAVDHIREHDQYRIVVFRSRKPGCFIAGADVTAIASLTDPDQVRAILKRGQDLMNQIASLKPVTVAAIDGSCLGGGLEFALACRYRIVSEAPHTKLGAPEIKLGLIPGWGGTQRLPRLVGLKQSLAMILKGSSVAAKKSVRLGLVDEMIDSTDFNHAIDQRVEDWVGGNGTAESQFAQSTFSQPGAKVRQKSWADRLLEDTSLGRKIIFHFARRKIKSQTKHYPALEKAIEAIGAAYDSSRDGYTLEREAFGDLLFTSTAQSLVGLFVQRDRAKKHETWLPNFQHLDAKPIRRLAMIGAGAMGAGIGGLAALKGINVVFKEVNEEAANAGMERVTKLFNIQLQHNRITALEESEALQRVSFTTNWDDTTACDLAIEAVLEVDSVKNGVFQMLDQMLPPTAALVSNTSSLNVTKMAMATKRSHQVAGLHFFNPVERMELVEVVCTEMTNDQTLAQLLWLVRKLGKTPIVTADQPGFLVNRILFPYLGEAVRLVAEGVNIETIDRELKRFGMPMGPLELIDQVGVDIASHVANSLCSIQTDSEVPTKLLSDMADRKWLGKKSGMGFYHWDNPPTASHKETATTKQGGHSQSATAKPRSSKKHRSNRELVGSIDQKSVPSKRSDQMGSDYPFKQDGLSEIQRRLVYPMLNEAVHCLDQQVIKSPWMVDLGMVLGTGFAPMHGGPLRLIDLIGVSIVNHNMQLLHDQWGQRFKPARGLKNRAANGELFFEPRTPVDSQKAVEAADGRDIAETTAELHSH